MLAIVFPGQGSQRPGMGQELFHESEVFRAIFSEIQQATGVDPMKICFGMDEEELRKTQNAQLALFASGLATYATLSKEISDIAVDLMAGHSIGEYTALAASGVISVSDGARLVQLRGKLMSERGSERPGGMAAILGMSRTELEQVCLAASTSNQIVVVANDNSPGQLVISGDQHAVARAGELASGAGAKRVVHLNVSGAFHSPLMENAAEQMGEALRQVKFEEGSAPVISNVTAKIVSNPSDWAALLTKQLVSPVRWTESVQSMLTMGADKFVECGPGEVLSGLIKRIAKESDSSPPPLVTAVQDTKSLENAKGLIAVEVPA